MNGVLYLCIEYFNSFFFRFTSKSDLSWHIKNEHCKSNETNNIKKRRNLPTSCDICNKAFRFHSNLERHKLVHTKEKLFLCNVCGKSFTQMSALKIHSFTHTGIHSKLIFTS